ncbi:MAG: arsenate reductase ArsC [Desulfobacterales bacterium]|jgi:arsenate reductase|nr:arsenate reductase ArsC [Desulfobacterales bacterium]MDD3081839.1 arsenate reductase ArsC [Desulfobacterales bacterium]MDD3950816.1 arsenate reductase ArsC [Desulfobacterales bacterium]MDD4464155.1 arsenate reductase ArsC [Desulfobacterales bacterium]MDY0377107.1 arsenate reductase ArsC [Desulfobacterales bacterium]
MKRNILFLCTQNACRSQMAEGFLRYMADSDCEAFSAGVSPSSPDRRAVADMREIGIDISGRFSKSVELFSAKSFDAVVTVCDHAKESCPVFPGARMLHWGFPDPAKARGTEVQIPAEFRWIRNLIRDRIRKALDQRKI